MKDKQTERLTRSFWEIIEQEQAEGVLPVLNDEDIKRIYHYMILLMDEYQGGGNNDTDK